MEQQALQQTAISSIRRFSKINIPLIIAICVLLVIMFAYSALNALLNYNESVQKMQQQVFPTSLSEYLTWVNILLQASASVLLIVGIFFKRFLAVGLLFSIVIIAGYTAYTELIVLNVFDRTPCACISLFNGMRWMHSLLFNCVALFLAVLAYLMIRREYLNRPYRG